VHLDNAEGAESSSERLGDMAWLEPGHGNIWRCLKVRDAHSGGQENEWWPTHLKGWNWAADLKDPEAHGNERANGEEASQ